MANVKEKNFCYVVIGKIADYKNNNVLPYFVSQKIQTISNEKIINQKRASYGVLLEMIKNIYNQIDDFSKVYQDINGKPVCENYYFSISHSCDLVAVALSDTNVGIDLQEIDYNKNYKNLAKIILNENEKDLSVYSMEDVIRLWAKKEAKFKYDGGENFVANKINTTSFGSIDQLVNYKDRKF